MKWEKSEMIRKAGLLITSFAWGGISYNAQAATVYSADAHLALEIVGINDNQGNALDLDNLPSALSIAGFDNSFENAEDSSVTGQAFADAVSTPFADNRLIELDVQVTGDSGDAYSLAQSSASAWGYFEFNNQLDSFVTIDMELSNDYSGGVETDTPAGQQFGRASIDMDLFGDFFLGDVLEISEISELGDPVFQGQEDFQLISFQLDAGGEEIVFAQLFANGEAETIADPSVAVSPIPVPASVYLLGSALVGLMSRRKKQQR